MAKLRRDPEAEYNLAIRQGNAERIRGLAQMGLRPPEFAMLQALLGQRPELLPALAEAGADPNADDGSTETALGHAVDSGMADIVELLLKLGADPEMEWLGAKPLVHAATLGNSRIVKLLLDHGASPGTREQAGITALLEAARYGYTEIVKMLFDAGADPFAIGPDDKTALDLAREGAHEGVVRFLQPLVRGKRRASKPKILRLIDAIKKADTMVVQQVIGYGVDVNTTDRFGHRPLMEAIEVGSEDIVRQLLIAGADPNLTEYQGNSPLDFAALRGETGIVRRLLRAGARKVSSNPLLPACTVGNVKLVAMLLRAGFPPGQRDSLGHTPLMNAAYAQSPELVELLLNQGAPVDPATPHDGWTALFFAVKAPSVHVSIQHLPSGSTISSAETRAPESGDDRARKIVEILLQHGADVNWQDKKGRTALTYVATADLATLLLQHGAKLHLQDKRRRDAVYWLRRSGFTASFGCVELCAPVKLARRGSARRRKVSPQKQPTPRRKKGPHQR